MSPPAPNGPLRSQPTRDRIIEAARLVFAREGYERATIRLVAAEAGVHPSMLTRYYGSKEQLFASAAEIDLHLPDMAEAPRATLGALLADHFLDRWEGSGADGQLRALLRAAASHEAARQKLAAIFDRQVRLALAAVPGLDRVETRAALIAAQLLGVAFTRHVARIPSIVALDRTLLASAITRTIQAHLDDPLPR